MQRDPDELPIEQIAGRWVVSADRDVVGQVGPDVAPDSPTYFMPVVTTRALHHCVV